MVFGHSNKHNSHEHIIQSSATHGHKLQSLKGTDASNERISRGNSGNYVFNDALRQLQSHARYSKLLGSGKCFLINPGHVSQIICIELFFAFLRWPQYYFCIFDAVWRRPRSLRKCTKRIFCLRREEPQGAFKAWCNPRKQNTGMTFEPFCSSIYNWLYG